MKNNNELEALSMEFENVSQFIRLLMSGTEKIIAIGVTISVTGLALGLKEEILEIIFLIPIATLGVFFYAIQVFTAILCLGGYKKHLEESINKILGKNTLIWETVTRKFLHRNLPINVLYFIYSLFFVFATAIALIKLFVCHESMLLTIFIIVVLSLLILLKISFRKMFEIYDKSYLKARHESAQSSTE